MFLFLCTLSWATPKGHTLYDMVRIPKGSFVMGGAKGEALERPLHKVEITRGFYIGKTEVSQQLFKEIMGYEPVKFWGDACKGYTHEAADDQPVYCVSWYESIKFANALSKRDGLEQCYLIKQGKLFWPKGLDCTGYRLPTEAEWEYAARSAQDGFYGGHESAAQTAWFGDNSNQKLHTIGSLAPNAWGIYDMCGSVWEWVWDFYGDYTRDFQTDPYGPEFGDYRVRRGGSWFNGPDSVRVGTRLREKPRNHFSLIGFRLVRTLPTPPLPKIRPYQPNENSSGVD